MRIGLYGPIANTGYTLAGMMHKAGYDVEYVHEPADTYPMSQPCWEDVELTLDPARLPDDPPSAAEWRSLAEEAGWVRPTWVVDAEPARLQDLPPRALLRVAALAARSPTLTGHLRAYLGSQAGLVRRLSGYDLVVVSGVRVLDAYLSGRPYVYWPNGGDLTIVPFRTETPHDRFLAGGIRLAIRHATVAGTHDPTLADGFGELGVQEVPFLPFLVDTDRWAPAAPDPFAAELRERAGGRTIFFLAARQDFEWKGTDRFVNAFVRALGEGAPLFLVVSPWGEDAAAVRAQLSVPGVAERVHFLDGVPSKPLLARAFRAADVVVDQFALGSHGSMMLEAMGCAAPVLISLDPGPYRRRWPDYRPPPVIDATTEAEIHTTLLEVAGGAVDLTELGAAARAWVAEVHGRGQAYRFVPGAAAYAATGSRTAAAVGEMPSSES